MKRMKKFLAVMLAAIMVMSMTTSVFAAGTASITITGVATDSHTFSAYQIFDGTVSGDTVSDLTWGSGIKYSDMLDAMASLADTHALYSYFGNGKITSSSTVAEVAAIVTTNKDNSTFVNAFAAFLKSYVGTAENTTNSGVADGNGTYTYTISNLDDGYYLVLDSTSSASSAADVVSAYILEVLTGTTNSISTKTSVPSVIKTVTDTNGNEESATSVSAGDTVSFTLTASMPSTYADYDVYSLVFHDTLTDNLTFNSSSVVVTVNTYIECTGLTEFVNGTTYYTQSGGVYTEVTDTTSGPVSGTTYYTFESKEVDSTNGGYSLVLADDMNTKDGCTFHVSIKNTNELKDANGSAITVNSSSTIVVTYTATAESSIDASTKESNSVKLEYSNNPTNTVTSERDDDKTTTTTENGTTEPSTVYVYTFDLEVAKTDGSTNSALSGAKFSLYKQVTLTESEFNADSSKYYTISGKAATTASGTTYSSTATYYTLVKENVEAEGNATNGYIATFNDLGEGTYALVESVTPSGYNTIDAVVFTITATYSNDGQTLESLSATSSSATFTSSSSTLKTTVQNYQGTELPTTGGIGTTIFYVIGTILVLGAALVLVNRRRMAR